MTKKWGPHLWCSAEGGGEAGGGGAGAGQPAGAPAGTTPGGAAGGGQTTPEAPPVNMNEVLGALSKLTTTLNAMGGRLDAIENRKPTDPPKPETPPADPPTPPKPGPSKAEQEARATAEKATAMAKRMAAKAALAGLKSDEYLKLAPAVELDDAGNLTEDTVKALGTFRKDHSELFHPGATGSTPGHVGTGADELTPEQRRQLNMIRVDPAATAKAAVGNPLAAIIGWEAPRQV